MGITLQPSETARLADDYYGLVAVREINKIGLVALLALQWSSITEIYNKSNANDKIVFSSTGTGGLIITNKLDEEITLYVRYLI